MKREEWRCGNCDEAVEYVDRINGAWWVHTKTGNFRCTNSIGDCNTASYKVTIYTNEGVNNETL